MYSIFQKAESVCAALRIFLPLKGAIELPLCPEKKTPSISQSWQFLLCLPLTMYTANRDTVRKVKVIILLAHHYI